MLYLCSASSELERWSNELFQDFILRFTSLSPEPSSIFPLFSDPLSLLSSEQLEIPSLIFPLSNNECAEGHSCSGKSLSLTLAEGVNLPAESPSSS